MAQKRPLFQWLAEKFPKNQNKELIEGCRELIAPHQLKQGRK
jgi:hypothetical protein